MPLVLGVDSSTQATKVEVRDADTGALVDSGRNPHPPTTPPRSEQPPDAWWGALEPLLRDDVAAISVAGQQHGMVVLDRDRRVIRPAKLWNDTESSPDAAALVERLGGPTAWADAVGTVPVAAITITKLAWLARVEPDAHAGIAHVLLPHDWITAQLCAELVTDRGDASGTGYWSPAEARWRADILELVGLSPDVVPPVAAPLEVVGARGGALVAPGTGDNMAAALGAGLRRGDVAVSIGTSGTAYTVSDVPTADPSGAVAGFADATGHYLPLVCTLNATKVTDAVARLLGCADHAAFDAAALSAPPGAGGVVLVPYFDGERTPNRPDATGSVSGLRSDVTPALLARAAVEGVVCGLLDAVDALATAGVPVDGGRMLLLGGGARSAAFRAVLADLSGRPIVVPAAEEHVAAGACVQAAAVLHQRPPEEVAAAWGLGTGHVVEPNPAVDRDAIRARYRAAV